MPDEFERADRLTHTDATAIGDVRGFAMATTGWTAGVLFIPVDERTVSEGC
jgi:hypothetical protein